MCVAADRSRLPQPHQPLQRQHSLYAARGRGRDGENICHPLANRLLAHAVRREAAFAIYLLSRRRVPYLQVLTRPIRGVYKGVTPSCIRPQCFGFGFVFYGSGSWNFFRSGSRIQAKNYFFKGNNKILGQIFVFNPKSRYFIFVFNQSSRYFI